MPTPMIPKRTRSLAGRGEASSGEGSSRTFPPAKAPAAPALAWRNRRREERKVMGALLARGPGGARWLLLQGPDRDFLEEDDVVHAVVLEPEVPLAGTWAALGLEVELTRRHRLAFRVVGHLHPVDQDHRSRSVEGDLHRVPLRAGLAGTGEGRGQGIEHAGGVVLVFLGLLGLVVDLDL